MAWGPLWGRLFRRREPAESQLRAKLPALQLRLHNYWHAACNNTCMTKQEASTGSAGQSGDNQGLSGVAEAGSESVEELLEEGQSFEAEAIGGVQDAPDPDVAEVHTKQVPEDDVPGEYLDQD